MVDYREEDGTVHVRRNNTGRIVGIVLVVALAIVALLFATGFWSADVEGGRLPEVSVKDGALPKVDLDSKEVVVGTSQQNVTVPKVETQKTTIDVPTVGVKDDKKDE